MKKKKQKTKKNKLFTQTIEVDQSGKKWSTIKKLKELERYCLQGMLKI